METASRAVCTFLQELLLLSLLVLPYRERFRYSLRATFSILLVFSSIYSLFFLLLRFQIYRLGCWHILTSSAVSLLISLLVTHLTRLRLSVTVFSVYLLKDLTDAIVMGVRLIHIYWLSDTVATACVVPFIYLIWFAALAPFILIFIRRDLMPCVESASAANIWRFLWMVPFTFYIFYRCFANEEYIRLVRSWSTVSLLMPFIWFTGVLVSHIAILKMMRETGSVASVKEQLRYSSMITELQKKEFRVLQEKIQETRKIRHDMHHQLIALEGYLKEADLPAAESYLKSLIRSVDLPQLKGYCQNLPANALINYYAQQAEENGVSFTCRAEFQETPDIPDTVFCTILGNLLENACEACQRRGGDGNFITLQIGHAGSRMLVLSVRNSYRGAIRVKDSGFLSSKHDGTGIGTASVNFLVRKYDGVVKFSYQDETFEASVLLPLGGTKALPAG